MKKTVMIILAVVISTFISSIIIKNTVLDRAVFRLVNDFGYINQVEVDLELQIEGVSISFNSLIESNRNVSRITSNLEALTPEETINTSNENYLLTTLEKVYFYTPHHIDNNLYCISEKDLNDFSTLKTQYSFLKDSSSYDKIDNNTYMGMYKYEDLQDFLGDYLSSITAIIGEYEFSQAAKNTYIYVTINLNNNRIESITFGLSEFYSTIISEILSSLYNLQLRIPAESSMSVKYSNTDNINIELPLNTIQIGLKDDSPSLVLNSTIQNTLNGLYDQDDYRFLVENAGYYQFNTEDDLGLVLNINNLNDDTYLAKENQIFSQIEQNSRIVYLEPGEYHVSLINYDLESENKQYSLNITQVDKPDNNDDYEWHKEYQSDTEALINGYSQITVKNNYLGDIDTIYVSSSKVSITTIKLPKGVLLVDYQNLIIVNSIETDDYNYYLVRYTGSLFGVNFDTWSISVLHSHQDSRATIYFEEPNM